MQETTLAIVAMISALGLTGVFVLETLIISQQVNAVRVGTGCTPDKQGFTASDGKCSHILTPPPCSPPFCTNGTNGRSFHS